MKLITELKLLPNFNNEDVVCAIAKKCKVLPKEVLTFEIVKQGIDARKKPNVFYVLNVAVTFSEKVKNKVSKFEDIVLDFDGLQYKKQNHNGLKPVVVGFGPSGMFCALTLSLMGLRPIVLEQGECVDEREKTINEFWNNRKLNPHSNVQFGEGGAGTFSDGKLNTTLNNPYCKKVINEFILNGAPKEIYYKNKAHIGTDNLKLIVKNIREKIIKNGGDVIFNAFFKDFGVKNGKIDEIFYKNTKTGEEKCIKTDTLILAIGHSAINTYELVVSKNVLLKKKPFAMGVRVEHKQSLINLAQYGVENPIGLPSADYKLVEHLPNGRSVFTFCMCPGGQVVASSSEEGTIVTNGMSEFARNKQYANSALLVNVNPEDFEGDGVLAGLYFQRKYEKMAFDIAGKNYNAPAQTMGSFLNGKPHKTQNNASYLPNVTLCQIKDCLPNFVTQSLKLALPLMDKKIKGFAGENNLMIAVESRSSAPVQFVREENYRCTISGLYSCGEGAGYAGGIVSSAVDGIKCAENVFLLKNNK